MSVDLIWCKLGDFNQNKTADLTYFVGTIEALAKKIKILLEVVFNVKIFFWCSLFKKTHTVGFLPCNTPILGLFLNQNYLIMLYFYLQNGELDLTFHIYRLSFLNFLLGKQANGPGQYLFGTVTPETPTCMFPIGKIHGPLQKWTDYSKLTMTKLGSRIS